MEAQWLGAPIRFEPVECFEEEKDPDGVLPPQMHILEGYLNIVVDVFRKAGLKTSVITRNHHGRPAAFKTYWERLKDNDWRWRQREILEIMLQEDFGRFGCPPGYGKSWLVGQFCKLVPKAKIDITTTSADVIRQIYEYLQELGLPSVGLVGAGKRQYGQRVTCYCGKSLHHSRHDADVLIVDELHEFGTDSYLAELAEYNKARRFGFSASHDKRPDGSDFELHGLFGPLLMDITYQEGVQHGCVVPMEVRWNPVLLSRDPAEQCNDLTSKERWAIWRNDERNEIVAEAARRYTKSKDQVLVIVAKIEHAIQLKRHLPEFTLCHGEMDAAERASYIQRGLMNPKQPQMTLDRRVLLTRAFRQGKLKKVIATGVWNRGVDFRRLGVLIRADGQASPVADIQIPGRLSRTAAEFGKEVGVVEDFMDQFNSSLESRAQRRRANYRKYGWSQVLPTRKRKSAVEQTYLF
jgi:superfamily II DNA or RNA helicase